MVSTTKGSAQAMPATDRFVGWLSGKAIKWLARRAAARLDWHEFNHCIAALMSGNSAHTDKAPCPMPPQGHTQPLPFQGVRISRGGDGS